jgi:hypothetical protein
MLDFQLCWVVFELQLFHSFVSIQKGKLIIGKRRDINKKIFVDIDQYWVYVNFKLIVE